MLIDSSYSIARAQSSLASVFPMPSTNKLAEAWRARKVKVDNKEKREQMLKEIKGLVLAELPDLNFMTAYIHQSLERHLIMAFALLVYHHPKPSNCKALCTNL